VIEKYPFSGPGFFFKNILRSCSEDIVERLGRGLDEKSLDVNLDWSSLKFDARLPP
jgi:hypothetical protein